MRDIIAPDGPIMQFFAKLWDLMLVSLLFTVTSIPVLTLGCTFTSLYYAVVKAVYHGEGHIIRAYFHCLRVNIRQGLGLGIAGTLLAGVLLGNLYLIAVLDLGTAGVIFGAVFVAILLVMLVLSAYLFPILSRFDVTIPALLQAGVQISVSHGMATMQLTVMQGMLLVCMAAAVLMFPPAAVICPGLIVYAQSKVLEPILQEYMPKGGGEHETETI